MERTSSQPTSLFPLTCGKRISINSFPRSHINSGTAKLILLAVSNLFAPHLISTETVDTILWHHGYFANRQLQKLKSGGRGGGCRKRSSTRLTFTTCNLRSQQHSHVRRWLRTKRQGLSV